MAARAPGRASLRGVHREPAALCSSCACTRRRSATPHARALGGPPFSFSLVFHGSCEDRLPNVRPARRLPCSPRGKLVPRRLPPATAAVAAEQRDDGVCPPPSVTQASGPLRLLQRRLLRNHGCANCNIL